MVKGSDTNGSVEDYLNPSFDPSTLTKPQLRSILASHGITDLPPSTARKEALVELFEQKVRAHANEIRRRRSRVRASDKGIARLDEQSQPSPRRSPSSARATIGIVGSARHKETSIGAEKRKRRGRSRKPRAETTNETRSTSITIEKRRSPSQSPRRHTTASRSPSKRRATTITSTTTKTASPLAALKTALPTFADSPQQATAKLHDRLEYIADVNGWRGAAKIVKGGQVGMKTTRSISPKHVKNIPSTPRSFSRRRSVSPTSIKAARSTLGKAIKNAEFPLLSHLIAWLRKILYYAFLTIVAIMLGLYVRFKFFQPLPYCDSGISLSSFLPTRFFSALTNTNSTIDLLSTANPINALANSNLYLTIWRSIANMCVPCPVHGQCKGGKLTCGEGYIPVTNWIAFGEDCCPDIRRLTLVEELSSRIRRVLAERAGRALCEEGREEGLTGQVFTEAQLSQYLREQFPRSEWNTAQFDSLYRAALDDITKNADTFGIAVSHNPIDGTVMFQSKNPIMGVACRVKRWGRSFYQTHKRAVWLTTGTGFLLIVLIFKSRERSRTGKRVQELVHVILQILAEQDALHRRDPLIPASISVPQIRDALFYRASARHRNRLWPLVCDAIQKNSNVRESIMYLKGEQTKVWEWIGSDVLSPLIRSQQ